MPRNTAQWLMVLCLLTAVLLRLIDLEQAPPGLHYDEAANLILAGDIGLRGERPIFITSYTGKETLFFYAAGVVMAGIGESIFALRLTAAFFGVLTIAATYRLGVILVRRRDAALLAAALLTTSFWHLLFSRLGFRAISQPLLQALALIALFQLLFPPPNHAKRAAWRDPNLWLSGIFLGGAAYTYLAVRLFPIALVLGLVPALFSHSIRQDVVKKVGAVTAVAAAVAGPLLLYFFRFPETFWVRINQVGQSPVAVAAPWQGVWQAVLMVGQRGDPYWRFNVPGEPLFNPLWYIFLIIGLISIVIQLFRERGRNQTAYALILIIPFVMLLPTALASGDILPSNLRAIGMIPFLFFWPALGAVELLALGYQILRLGRDQTPRWILLMSAIVVAVLAVEGSFLANRYFNEWAQRSDVFYENDADLAAVAAYLEEDSPPETIYLAAPYDQHPTVAALSERYNDIRWLPEGKAIVWPAEGEGRVIFPHNQPLPEWASQFLETPLENGPTGPDEAPLFQQFLLAEPPAATEFDQSVTGNFGYAIRLIGSDIPTATSGRQLTVTLYWQIEGRPQTDLTLFYHLEDSWGHRWSQVESSSYPTRHWTPGERLLIHEQLPLPEGIPPGFYRLKVGWFEPTSGQQVARFDLNGRYAGTAAIFEEIPVLPAAELGEPLAPPIIFDEQIVPELLLIGSEPLPASAEAGETIATALYWRSEGFKLPAVAVRYELLRPNRTGMILTERPPVHGSYPFSSWANPQQVIDRQHHRLPVDLPTGDYTIHLRVLGNDDTTLFERDLGVVAVIQTERLFVVPPVDESTAALLGGEIILHGVNRSYKEESVEIELIWQAVERPAADYTIFFHVLEDDGICCAWQSDRRPEISTDRWVQGQVVVERFVVPLDDFSAGVWPLEVGLYLPESGIRLAVAEPNGSSTGLDYVFLEPITVDGE